MNGEFSFFASSEKRWFNIASAKARTILVRRHSALSGSLLALESTSTEISVAGDSISVLSRAMRPRENPMLNGETIRLDGAIRMAPR